ncbi:hypothetical protein MHUMG1_00069 [Metarhizium humberi]|uniref:Uncharacterized protein n=1 Tax=Metarhizium humberi TaxID=2596975 RepID=A0A9P8MK10_9HYPO|nr:hypothetical protein MHUMG1_00069 [Metarhizium humberi]
MSSKLMVGRSFLVAWQGAQMSATPRSTIAPSARHQESNMQMAWDVNCFAESRRLRLRQPRTPPSGARDLSLRLARGAARNIISQPHYAAIPAPDWTIGSSPGHLARGASRINPTLAHADRGCHQPSPQERRLRPLTSAFVFSQSCNRSNVPIRGPCKHPSQAEPLKPGWDAWLLQDKSHLQYLALVVFSSTMFISPNRRLNLPSSSLLSSTCSSMPYIKTPFVPCF